MQGSKTITLEITQANLFAQMKDHSYYLGEALKSDQRIAELAAKIQAGDDDDDVLKDFIKSGGGKLNNIMSTVLGKTTYSWDVNNTKITFTTKAVSNFMQSQEDALKGAMLDYLSNYVLAKWLNLIKPDEAKRFEEQLIMLEQDLRLLGSQREKPVRST